MFSTLRLPLLGKALITGAAGSAILAAGLAASPAVLAASPTAKAATATAKPTTHGNHRDHSDHRVKIEAYLDASAKVLNMEPGALRAALKSGRSLEDIAAEHGFAKKEVFADAVSKAIKPLLDADVDAKKLTRAEADRFQDRLAHGHLPYWVRHHKK